MALTDDEIMLLNTLLYMNADGENNTPLIEVSKFENITVGEWLNNIQIENISDDVMYDAAMTGREWKNVIAAVKSNDELMNMTIMTTHVDDSPGGGNGLSALFVDDHGVDAVVAFRGTQGADEWYDNFAGGNVVETPAQRNALNWYQGIYKEYNLESYGTVTVSGHSKGGNKSKFITIMDDTVDRCVSIDGQGFSDEFFTENSYQIAKNQSKIHNHNIDYDPVNILLNDVGEKTYYIGQDIDDFMENHAPNSFFKFGENGNYELIINPNGQSVEMQEMDGFLNGYLRSMSDSKQTQSLDMVGRFVQGLNQDAFEPNAKNIIDLIHNNFLSSEHRDELAYLLAYTIKYEQTHPEFSESIKSVLKNFGMDGVSDTVDIVCDVLNFKTSFLWWDITFDDIYGAICDAGRLIPFFIPFYIVDNELVLLCAKLNKDYDLGLSVDELKDLFSLLGMIRRDLGIIELNENGNDIWIGPLMPGVSHTSLNLTEPMIENEQGDFGKCCYFFADLTAMRTEADNLLRCSENIDRL